jgi:hypothetical protein
LPRPTTKDTALFLKTGGIAYNIRKKSLGSQPRALLQIKSNHSGRVAANEIKAKMSAMFGRPALSDEDARVSPDGFNLDDIPRFYREPK